MYVRQVYAMHVCVCLYTIYIFILCDHAAIKAMWDESKKAKNRRMSV